MSIWKRAFVIIAAGYASLADAIVTAVTLGIYYPNFTGRLLAHFNYWGTAPSAPREKDGSPNWTDIVEHGQKVRVFDCPIPDDVDKKYYRRMKQGELVSRMDRIFLYEQDVGLFSGGSSPTWEELGAPISPEGFLLHVDGSRRTREREGCYCVGYRDEKSEWADVNMAEVIAKADAARARFVLEPPEGYRFLKVGDYTKYGDMMCIGEGLWYPAHETYFGARCVEECGYLKNIAGATSVRVARKEIA